MISVAYETTALAESPFGGIAQVCHHTLDQARRHSEITPTALYRRGNAANLGDQAFITARRWSWFDTVRSREFDIVHALCHRLPAVTGHKTVYTLYDTWSLHPNRFQSHQFQKRIGARMLRHLRKADAVVSISEWTRQQLLNLDIVPPERCHVAVIGAEPPSGETAPPRGVDPERSFVLFVGRLEVRKNLPHVISAVRAMPGLQLVIVGEPGYGHDEIARSHLSQLPSERLTQLDCLPRPELDWLYSHALAVLAPSHEEGFGLPVLEAMLRGCPVITSDRSACAEVGESAAVLVDPEQPSETAEALVRLQEDEGFREGVIAAGLKRGEDFGWEGYFDRLYEVYDRLLS